MGGSAAVAREAAIGVVVLGGERRACTAAALVRGCLERDLKERRGNFGVATVGYGEIGLKRLKKVGLAHLRGQPTVGNPPRARALVGLWVWRARPTGAMG